MRLASVSTLMVISITVACLNAHAAGELKVFDLQNRTGTSATMDVDKIYTWNQIPNGLNNKISSFRLNAGYGVVFSDKADGTGVGKFYSAKLSTLYQNSLPSGLRNEFSYVRVVKLWSSMKKKGFGWQTEHTASSGSYTNLENLANALGAKWYYNWGYQRWSTSTMEYIPMKWGKANVSTFVDHWDTRRTSCVLAFNEPDNSDQSNISVADAVNAYEDLLAVGLRMGSPVTEQDTYDDWLEPFIDECTSRNLRVDFLAAHWYDWGNQNQSSTGQQIADRLKAKMINFRNTIGAQKVWLTEFNCNPNRTSQSIHADFIVAATSWLNSTSWIERYAYFQPPAVAFTTSSSTLTASGNAYKNASSPSTGYNSTNNLGY